MEFRKELLGIEDYIVPPLGPEVRLNLNEAAAELPASIKREIVGEWLAADWRRYPAMDDAALLQIVGRYCGHDPGGICIGAGSNELIQALSLAFLGRHKKLLIPDPCFSVYERLARILGADVVKTPLNENFQYDTAEILRAARATKPDLAVFPSPHNPCGDILEEDEVEAFVSAVPGVVVIDEAYFEFAGATVRRLIDRQERLIVLRTFSKAFSLAGLRAGYMLGRPDAIRVLRKLLPPFSFNTLNQIALRIVLEREDMARTAVERTVKERERLAAALSATDGVRVFPSRANFVFTRIAESPDRSAYDQLLARGIVIRKFGSPSLAGCYRISVGAKKENDIFLDVLKEVMNGKKE